MCDYSHTPAILIWLAFHCSGFAHTEGVCSQRHSSAVYPEQSGNQRLGVGEGMASLSFACGLVLETVLLPLFASPWILILGNVHLIAFHIIKMHAERRCHSLSLQYSEKALGIPVKRFGCNCQYLHYVNKALPLAINLAMVLGGTESLDHGWTLVQHLESA